MDPNLGSVPNFGYPVEEEPEECFPTLLHIQFPDSLPALPNTSK